MPLPTGYVTSYPQTLVRGVNRLRRGCIVREQVWTDPATAVTNGFSASHVGLTTAGTSNMTLGGSLTTSGVGYNAHPRNVVITVTHASAVVAMSGTITGKDTSGKVTTEAWAVTAGTTSKTSTGVKAFASVTSITETIAADASGNTIIAGSGVVLGLDSPCALGGTGVAVKEIVAGSLVTTGVLVASSTSASADAVGTYAPATAPNGSNDYQLFYLSDDA